MEPYVAGKEGRLVSLSTFPFYIEKKPQLPFDYHRHRFLELVYVWSGNAVHVANEQKMKIRSGDVFFLTRSDRHGYEDCNGLEIVNILFFLCVLGKQAFRREEFHPFYEAILAEPFSRRPVLQIHLDGVVDLKVRSLIEEMLAEFEHKMQGREEVLKNDFSNLLIILSRVHGKRKIVIKTEEIKISLQWQKFQRVLRYMEENFGQRITLQNLADMACFSPNYFSEIFHKIIGKTFSEYLAELRMNHAAVLLKNTDMGVKLIVEKCGMSDYRHFTRSFKEAFGLSPGRYRKGAISKEKFSAL